MIGTPARADAPDEALEKYNTRVDQAVDKALAFLASKQQPNGSFAGAPASGTAVTGLSVMAFLAKGHTPGCGPYGEVINKGIDFILASQDNNGLLVGKAASHGAMYLHSIATLMLSEVSGMVDAERQKKVDAALAKAIKVILSAQAIRKPAKQQGGWRYQHTSPDSDISCTGWALMALRSARNAGMQVPKKAIDDGVGFLMACRCPDGGFAYQPGGDSGLARTGTALLGLELCGRHRDKAAIDGGEWILKHLPGSFGEGFFYYALYHSSQAMFQLGGNYWVRYAIHIYEMMLKYQAADGSWPPGAAQEGNAGVCYSTAIGALALSVTYRQLPIYQR